jgi:hypothetical protein
MPSASQPVGRGANPEMANVRKKDGVLSDLDAQSTPKRLHLGRHISICSGECYILTSLIAALGQLRSIKLAATA